jgi:AsmA family protein
MGKIIKILVVLVLLVVVALAGVILTTDINQYKGQIVQAVKDNTGRDFEISGDLQLAASLIPTVAIEGVSLGNANWSKEKTMLSVGKFEVQVALMPLLKKNIQVNRIILIEPNIHLETNKEGVGNWVFAEKTPEKKDTTTETASGEMPSLNVNEIVIEKANLTYIDGVKGTTQKLHIEELSVEADSFSKPLNLVLEASYNDIPITASGELGSVNSLKDNEEFTIDVEASVNKIEITTKGKIAKPKDAKGFDVTLTLNMDSLASVSEITKQELPAVGPINVSGNFMEKDGAYILSSLKADIDKTTISGEGKISDPENLKGVSFDINLNSASLSDLNTLAGSELPDMAPLAFSGKISDKGNNYEFKGFKLQVGDIKVSGEAAINISGKRPALTANLTSDTLNLIPFMPEEKEKQKKDKVFPSDPLPLEGLKAADVDLTFKTKKLITKDITINDANLSLKLNNGKLQLNKSGKAAGGTLAVKVGLDASGKSAILNNDIELKQIDLGQLAATKDVISGAKTDITIKAKGSGTSVSKIMAGLNGKLLIKAGKGNISNKALDIASADALVSTLSLINPGANKQEGSTLECAIVNFDIKDGIATADKGIGISTNRLYVYGGGTVNLKTEGLDIGIQPKAREGVGLNLSQLAGLVRVGGTLANPAPKADTKAALSAGLSAGAALATGGLSLLGEGAMSGGSEDAGNPCDVALGIAPKKKAATTTTKKPAADKSAVEKTTDTVKDAAGAIGDKLKSLF